MCWSCGCGKLEDDHGDSRSITTVTLESAAKQCKCSLPEVVGNIVIGLSHFDPQIAAKKATLDSSEEPELWNKVVKASNERRYTLGLAYPAMRPDCAKAADGFVDFIRPDKLENAAWSWMAHHREINLFHSKKSEHQARGEVVESYIYRGPDWEIATKSGKITTIMAGDWLVGAIWDETAWPLVKASLVNGWSPEGGARRITPDLETLNQLRR